MSSTVKKVTYEEANLPLKIEGLTENYGVAHIYAGKNDTFIHVTDLSGRETIARTSGGCKVKRHSDEPSPYAAMQATADLIPMLNDRGITALHILIRGDGGTGRRTPGQAANASIRAFVRGGLKVGRIEDVTPVPTDRTRHKGGRRGRRR